jgi:hypothetical protein
VGGVLAVMVVALYASIVFLIGPGDKSRIHHAVALTALPTLNIIGDLIYLQSSVFSSVEEFGSIIALMSLPMLSFVSWLRKKKITPRFYCSYPLCRVFGPDVLFLTTGEPSGLAGAQLAPHMGSRCLIPIWIMKHFTVMDSFIKYVALVVVWILPVALQVINIIIYILWFCLHPHLVIMLFLGQFLMSTQLLSIRNVQNVWISLFAKNTGKAISSLDWLWDGPLYNENKFTDIMLNTGPLLIVQAYNNTAIGIWTTIAVLNFITSSVLVIDLVTRYVYWVLIQGKGLGVVNETASCFFFFCRFEIVSTKEKEKYMYRFDSHKKTNDSSSNDDGGVELKPATSPNPIHHEHELQLALDAIRKDLRISSALDSDDIHKALLKAGIKELI